MQTRHLSPDLVPFDGPPPRPADPRRSLPQRFSLHSKRIRLICTPGWTTARIDGAVTSPGGPVSEVLFRLTLDPSQTYHPPNDERATP